VFSFGGGHLKTGRWWTGRNRGTEAGRGNLPASHQSISRYDAFCAGCPYCSAIVVAPVAPMTCVTCHFTGFAAHCVGTIKQRHLGKPILLYRFGAFCFLPRGHRNLSIRVLPLRVLSFFHCKSPPMRSFLTSEQAFAFRITYRTDAIHLRRHHHSIRLKPLQIP